MQSTSESSSKKQVLSDLVEARNAIKSKFKKAYEERISLEKGVKQLMKPVLSSFGEFQNKSLKKNHDKISYTTPKTSTKTGFRKKKSTYETDSMGSSTDVITPTRSRRSRKANQTPFDSSSSQSDLSFATPLTGTIKKTQKKKEPQPDDEYSQYEYIIDQDDDRVDNYSKIPENNVKVYGSKIHKVTNKTIPIVMKFKKLPQYAQKQWIEERRTRYRKGKRSSDLDTNRRLQFDTRDNDVSNSDTDACSDTDADTVAENDEDQNETIAVNRGRRVIRKPNLYGSGNGLSKKNKPFDFNFIPYNSKEKIIYNYFDDPNELCSRLQLLISSRNAGNNSINHIHEISSIIEELRELGHIA